MAAMRARRAVVRRADIDGVTEPTADKTGLPTRWLVAAHRALRRLRRCLLATPPTGHKACRVRAAPALTIPPTSDLAVNPRNSGVDRMSAEHLAGSALNRCAGRRIEHGEGVGPGKASALDLPSQPYANCGSGLVGSISSLTSPECRPEPPPVCLPGARERRTCGIDVMRNEDAAAAEAEYERCQDRASVVLTDDQPASRRALLPPVLR
jgi:hypothetical protein